MGLLSHTISIQSLLESIPKTLSLERKEGEDRKEEEGGVRALSREKRESEREWGGREIFIPH